MSDRSRWTGEITVNGLANLLHAFPALDDAARRIAESLPDSWNIDLDLEALLTSAFHGASARHFQRLVGMREPWKGEDPAVMAFTSQLFGYLYVVPEPEEDVVSRLAALEGFEREGKVVALDGVPVPAGEDQVRFFVTLRWHQLFSPLANLHLIALRNAVMVRREDHAELQVEEGHQPHLRHLVGYDACHTTDEAQQTLLTYSTAVHRQNLIALQAHDLSLFVAVWRRDFAEIKKLIRGKPLAYLVPADSRSKRMKSASTRLLYGTAIMSEFERLFEIAEYLTFGGVSREAIDRLIKSASSLSDIQAGSTLTHRFVSGIAAHGRCLNSTMNGFVSSGSTDPALKQVNTAFRQTKSYWKSVNRLRKPSGEMPAMYFLGIEPQFLTTAAIMMMMRNLKHLEGNFTYRHKHRKDGQPRSDTLIVRLGIIIMANICVPTARAMRKKIDRETTDAEWLSTEIPALVYNPQLMEAYGREQEKFALSPAGIAGPPIAPLTFVDEEDRKGLASQVQAATERVKLCPDVKRPGWTRGFHFQAWFTPAAELGFLRKCCRLVQFDPRAQRLREKWTVQGEAKKLPNYTGSPSTTFTGLPRKHPLENIQDKMRPIFENLQYAERLNRRWTVDQRAIVDAFVAEVARALPAISPCTVDPHLNEAIVHTVDPVQRKFAIEAAWNC